MTQPFKQTVSWHAGPTSWGPSLIAILGCALPLILGLLSGHPGFLWAAVGAFQASQAEPLHRFGMLRMLMLTLLGALSAGLGIWAAQSALLSLVFFASYGFLLAWLQRFGNEAGKFGIGLAICLCLGQGLYEHQDLRNGDAVAALFILGGLWVALLAFALRGAHGLRMWPHMPRLMAVLRVLKRHAKRLPERKWRLHALCCALACGFAGLIVQLAGLEFGHWLTIALFVTLQLEIRDKLSKIALVSFNSFITSVLLAYLGFYLNSTTLIVALCLLLIAISRALQPNQYSLFVLQLAVTFTFLAESLVGNWQLLWPRIFSSFSGVILGLVIALLIHWLSQWLLSTTRRIASTKKPS